MTAPAEQHLMLNAKAGLRAPILIRLSTIALVVAICAPTRPSWARALHKNWQTGALVKRGALTPTETLGQKLNCSWPETIYTVDSSVYTYQFLGWPFEFYPRPMPLAIVFRVYADGHVRVRDPKTKH